LYEDEDNIYNIAACQSVSQLVASGNVFVVVVEKKKLLSTNKGKELFDCSMPFSLYGLELRPRNSRIGWSCPVILSNINVILWCSSSTVLKTKTKIGQERYHALSQ